VYELLDSSRFIKRVQMFACLRLVPVLPQRGLLWLLLSTLAGYHWIVKAVSAGVTHPLPSNEAL
jgi:hypothetical protein